MKPVFSHSNTASFSKPPKPLNFPSLDPAIFQVDRVLKPGGIVGLVSINTPKCMDSTTMDTAQNCVSDLITKYGLPDKVKLLQDNYKNLEVPYPTRKDHMVDILTSWSLDDYLDVIMTFSPVNNMIKRKSMTVIEGRVHVTTLLREEGMTEQDMNSVYTWSQQCAMVTASKP